jgi:hypothetical protein
MTTTVTVVCDSCQATYQAPKDRAGARFKCKACGAKLTVPHQDAPERPVVMPSSPPPAEHARPVVMPSGAALPPERPVVAPKDASLKPASHGPPRHAKPRPERPERPERPAHQARGHAHVPGGEARKSKMNLSLIVVGGIGLLALGGYFAWPKDTVKDGPKKPDDAKISIASPKEEPPAFDAKKRIADLQKEAGSGSAAALWALAKKLKAEAAAWRDKLAPETALEDLAHAREIAMEDVVKLDPDHAEARAARLEVKYNNELDPFFDAAYLSDSDRDLVRKNRLSLQTLAGSNGGWVSKKQFDLQAAPLVDRLSALQAEAEKLAASPFGKAAKNLEAETLAYLSKQLGGKTAFRAFIHKPYVIFVEENAGWSPMTEAKTLFSPLKAILDAFLREFGGLGLEPLEMPVPVVYFVSEERYGEYNKSIGNVGMNVLAHYEPTSGRLVLNRGVNHEVVIHEGTHQIFDKYTKNMLPHPRQSFWFQEGIAEWFGGSNRLQAKDGSWTYETGVLLEGRLGEWRTLEEHEFKLADLLQQTYTKRNEYMIQPDGQKKIGLVYAQGWFFIYFMNHFNVGADGMVKIGQKGKYADGWSEYLKSELNGKTGKKVFMECLKLDDAALERMHREYVDYFKFVVRKQNLGQVKDKKLVAWDQYVNKKGQKTGEKDDDLLIAQPRNK